MKTTEIQDIILLKEFERGKKIATTNFSACGLSECDVIMISDSEMVWEYEIKRSRADFKADFKKEHKHLIMKDKASREASFMYYNEGWFTCPNYFYYVCEEDLIKVQEVPEYAGLMYVTPLGSRIVKRPKKLHNYKATQRLIYSIARNQTARMIFGCSYMNYKHGK